MKRLLRGSRRGSCLRRSGICDSQSGNSLPGKAASDVLDFDALRTEIVFQDIKAALWLHFAAHKDVDGGIAVFRPSMNRDMGLRQQNHAGKPRPSSKVIGLEAKNVGLGRKGGTPQRICCGEWVMKGSCVEEVGDQVQAQ